MISKAQVLVVEDETLIADLVLDALEEEGLVAAHAETFDAAIEVARGATDTLKVLLTDIRLPDSRSGFEVARAVREAVPTVFVLYVTGDSEADHGAEGVRGSMLVPKPYRPTDLAAQIAEMVKVVGTYKD